MKINEVGTKTLRNSNAIDTKQNLNREKKKKKKGAVTAKNNDRLETMLELRGRRKRLS